MISGFAAAIGTLVSGFDGAEVEFTGDGGDEAGQMIPGKPIVKGRREKVDLIEIIGPEPLLHTRTDELLDGPVAGIFTGRSGIYSDRLSGCPTTSGTR